MASTILEPHELDSRVGQHCDHCHTWSVIEVDVAIADRATLQVLTHVTCSVCTTCGFEEVTR